MALWTRAGRRTGLSPAVNTSGQTPYGASATNNDRFVTGVSIDSLHRQRSLGGYGCMPIFLHDTFGAPVYDGMIEQ